MLVSITLTASSTPLLGLHDTVGIIYQFTSADNFDATTSLEPEVGVNEQGPLRRRRRFNEISREIRPYYSKPKTNLQLLQ